MSSELPSGDARAFPQRIYHYTSIASLIGIVDSCSIWASNARYLNDTAELETALGLLREHRKAIDSAMESWQLAVIDAVLRTFSVEGTRVFVASFSADPDSLNQWRAYCPPNAGYAIGFDADALWRCAARDGFRLMCCSYDLEEQSRRIAQVVERTFEYLGKEVERRRQSGKVHERVSQMVELSAPGDDSARQALEDVFSVFHTRALGEGYLTGGLSHFLALTKDPAFVEEREWRLVAEMHPNVAQARVLFRAGRSMLVPYIPLSLAGSAEELPIAEIVVGPTPHPELARAAVRDFLSARKLERVTVRISRAPYRSW